MASIDAWLRPAIASWQAATSTRRAVCLAVFCAVLFVLVNWHNYPVDAVPQNLVPVTLLREGTVCLDSYRPYYDSLAATGQQHPFRLADGHLYPRNSLYVSFLLTPFFAPPVLAGVATDSVSFWIAWGRFAGAVITGGAIALCYLTVRRWTNEGGAIAFTLALAFGTCVWTNVAQTPYDHLGGFLCVAAMSHLLHDFPLSSKRAGLAAFFAGAAVGMRPSAVVLLLPLGLYLFFCPGRFIDWKARLAALAGVAVIPLSNAWLNAYLFGSWYATGYSRSEADHFSMPIWEGFSGLLFAPNSGLFVQSPFLLLACLGSWIVWSGSEVRKRGLLRTYTLCFLADVVLYAKWYEWHGGLTFATRMLCESYPLLLPLVAVGWERTRGRKWAIGLVTAACVWAVFYEIIGVALFDAVCEANPPHRPWNLSEHFYWVYVRQNGFTAALMAVSWTVAQFVGVAVLGGVLLKRFILAELAGAMLSRPNCPGPCHLEDAGRESM